MRSSSQPPTIVITGASDGIGAAAAAELKRSGAQVVIHGRSAEKTARVAAELDVPYHVADFADLAQVRRLAAELDAAHPRIDVLANNAGGIMGKRTVTVDGNEKTMQVNHLAGFLLTQLLLPKLIASQATVIQTSSMAARLFSDFDPEDFQQVRYTPEMAYGNAKLANILFTTELQRRYGEQGISAVAFHPGVVGTNFASETTHPMRWLYRNEALKGLFTRPPARGADQLVWLATSTPGVDWRPGEYYVKRKLSSVGAVAKDPNVCALIWERSEQLVRADADTW